MRAIAIDFETANPARASACAVGLAVIEDGVVVETAYHLIRPKPLTFGYFETRVHGITAEDVAGAPEFPGVFAAIRPYLGSHLLMAHNQAFDVSVLKASAEFYGLDLPAFDVLCTLELSRAVWRDRRGHKLSDVAGYLGLEFRHHHAEDDALMAARIGLHAAGLTGVAGMRAAAKRDRRRGPSGRSGGAGAGPGGGARDTARGRRRLDRCGRVRGHRLDRQSVPGALRLSAGGVLRPLRLHRRAQRSRLPPCPRPRRRLDRSSRLGEPRRGARVRPSLPAGRRPCLRRRATLTGRDWGPSAVPWVRRAAGSCRD